MVCTPTTVGVTCSVALPATSVTAVPPFREIVVVPTVSLKLTAPAGTVAGVVVSLTTAVSVAVCPATTATGFTVKVVDVVSVLLKEVPVTETCWVLPATLSALSVTVIPALRLPTDCGVNCTDTSHDVPDNRDVVEVHRFVSAVFAEIEEHTSELQSPA